MADVLSSLAAAVADARAQVHVGPMPTVLGDRVALVQLLQNLSPTRSSSGAGRAPACG